MNEQTKLIPLSPFQIIEDIKKGRKNHRYPGWHPEYREWLENDLERGSVDYTFFHWLVKQWEPEYKKELDKIHNEFVLEIFDEDHMWIKECRLAYLNSLRDEYRELVLPFVEWVNRLKGTAEKYIGDNVNEEWVIPMLRKLKKVETEIEGWTAPVYESDWFSQGDLDRARETDCTEYLDIKRKDHTRSWALCPFHTEKTPSFCVFQDSNKYHCFGCGEHGDSISLVKKLYNLEFKEAVNFILKR